MTNYLQHTTEHSYSYVKMCHNNGRKPFPKHNIYMTNFANFITSTSPSPSVLKIDMDSITVP